MKNVGQKRQVTKHQKKGEKIRKKIEDNRICFLNRKQKRQRQENSLDELTRAFIKYVKDSKIETININDIVKKLKVKKRRIYDITNVLEGNFHYIYTYYIGIGYIKKQAKNQVTWTKKDEYEKKKENIDNNKPKEIEPKMEELKQQNEMLQKMIETVQKKLEKTTEFNYTFAA